MSTNGDGLDHHVKVKDDKKRKRDLDDQDNYGQGIKNITPVLSNRPYLIWTSDLHQKFLKAIEIIHQRKTCIDSNTTNSTTTQCATPNTQDFVASTCLNEVGRQPELEVDISWINNLIEFEGWNDTTLQGLQHLPN
ncbi:hypothetical protein SAY86_031019 [Trapa natans]|uniref:Uncharacterized protein n=1 Tax=Trapa natans TaxID=22666 RepID=A0AAN7RJ50_TRANT|nr:hypothetical protein SAY86_031019 [Trapa natans]